MLFVATSCGTLLGILLEFLPHWGHKNFEYGMSKLLYQSVDSAVIQGTRPGSEISKKEDAIHLETLSIYGDIVIQGTRPGTEIPKKGDAFMLKLQSLQFSCNIRFGTTSLNTFFTNLGSSNPNTLLLNALPPSSLLLSHFFPHGILWGKWPLPRISPHQAT